MRSVPSEIYGGAFRQKSKLIEATPVRHGRERADGDTSTGHAMTAGAACLGFGTLKQPALFWPGPKTSSIPIIKRARDGAPHAHARLEIL